MKPPLLQDPDKKKVRLASRLAVQKYFSELAAAGGSTHWLDLGNRYRKSATQTYEDDLKPPGAVNDNELIAYIAASAPTHLIDGWSYLSRATEAVLRGDLNAALHLGYYAELRAAMSILACEGVGVFNRKHPVISPSGGSTTTIQKSRIWKKELSKYENRSTAGTHVIVWPMLSHWGSLKRAGNIIDELIAPDGTNLSVWLDALNIPWRIRAISKKWLSDWGIDLSMLNEDHESRNMVSYRPSELRLAQAPSAQNAIEFVSDLWALFEPRSGGRFPQLERELLRKIVRDSHISASSSDLQSKLGMDATIADNWEKYLNSSAEPLPLGLAMQSSDVEDTNCALQVISRAALLLFMATGSTRKHLIDAGYSPEMLEFFWRRLCEVRFDGPADSLPDDPIDLWRDIEDHITEAKSWSKAAKPDTSLGEWRKIQPDVMNQIVGFELASVWGLVS